LTKLFGKGLVSFSLEEKVHTDCKAMASNTNRTEAFVQLYQVKMSYKTLGKTVFRQSAANLCFVDSFLLIIILEFAVSFENVLLILQTCQEWNDIINKTSKHLKVYPIRLPRDNTTPMMLRSCNGGGQLFFSFLEDYTSD